MAEGGVGISDVKRGQSPEYKALTKSYSMIVDCIARSPGEITDQLISLQVLSKDEISDLRSSRLDREKARKIMDIVKNKVESMPSFLYNFISIMEKYDWMKPYTDVLKANLKAQKESKQSTGTSEQATDKMLTMEDKEIILDTLVKAKAQWYYIGEGIGVEDCDLMEIDNRYLPDKVRCLDEVLTRRLQQGGLTLSILCKSLRGKRVKRDDVARLIEALF